MESLGKMVSLILAVFLLFISPLFYISMKQDTLNQFHAMSELSYFVDSVRNIGYISENMYQSFERQLRKSGNIYEIEMIHYQGILYGDMQLQEHYYEIYTEEIRGLIQEKGEYFFRKGDYFTVKVYKKNQSMGERMQEMFLRVPTAANQTPIIYGGMIKDEID